MVMRQEIKHFSGRRRWRFISSFIEQYKTKLWIMHMEMAYAVVTLIPEIQKNKLWYQRHNCKLTVPSLLTAGSKLSILFRGTYKMLMYITT